MMLVGVINLNCSQPGTIPCLCRAHHTFNGWALDSPRLPWTQFSSLVEFSHDTNSKQRLNIIVLQSN